jgi:hypothetical protein
VDVTPAPPPAVITGLTDDGLGARITWPLGREDGARAQLDVFFDESGDGEIIEIRLRNPNGMTPSSLQRFPWKRWVGVADAELRYVMIAEVFAELDAPRAIASRRALRAGADARRAPRGDGSARPGRRGHPDEHYRAVADRYRVLATSLVRNPTAQIATECFVARSTAAGWVATARKRGYLPPARRGRPG